MKADTTIYKARLEAMHQDLIKELQAIGIHDPTNPKNWIAISSPEDSPEADIDLVADEVEESDERQALVATLEPRYNNVMRALKKINEGTFGVCEICGAPIEIDRLEANPSARTDKSHMDNERELPF